LSSWLILVRAVDWRLDISLVESSLTNFASGMRPRSRMISPATLKKPPVSISLDLLLDDLLVPVPVGPVRLRDVVLHARGVEVHRLHPARLGVEPAVADRLTLDAADGVRQDMTVSVERGRLHDDPRLCELAGDGVIVRELPERAVAQQIAAAIADMRDVQLIAERIGERERGAHLAEGGIFTGPLYARSRRPPGPRARARPTGRGRSRTTRGPPAGMNSRPSAPSASFSTTSTARALARAPPPCPPMPSATTNRWPVGSPQRTRGCGRLDCWTHNVPVSAAITNWSSLVERTRPRSVMPQAVTNSSRTPGLSWALGWRTCVVCGEVCMGMASSVCCTCRL
jgi:hypothetical protein